MIKRNSSTQSPKSVKSNQNKNYVNTDQSTEPTVDVIQVRRRRGRPRKEDVARAKNYEDEFGGNEVDLNDSEYGLIEKIKKEKTKEPKPDKKKYYVDTVRLKDIILKYYDDNVITDELAMCLFNIANRVSYMPNFINYSWREEMIGDGLVKEFQALKNKKFDPEKGKAFSYFSMIVYNAFCNRIKKELKEKLVVKEFQEEQYSILMPNQGNGRVAMHDEAEDGDFG